MRTYVALVADATGRYCHVYGTALDWPSFVNQLEEVGVEVVEDQTSDYDDVDTLSVDDMKEYDVVTVQELTILTDAILF
jgi:hypothetical protein